MRLAPVVLIVTGALLTTTSSLTAQEHKLGTLALNLQVASGGNVGVTWRVSPAVSLRPVVSFRWDKVESPFGNSETTSYAVGLDLLFRTSSWNRLSSYVGAGGFVGNTSGATGIAGNLWGAHALVGARLSVVDRVALFGEVDFRYLNGEGFQGKRVDLGTQPLGIMVFLK